MRCQALFVLSREIQIMKTLVKKGLTLSLATMVLAASSGALRAADDHGAAVYKVTDVAVVRPVALGLTVVGGALFLVTWPITAASGDSDETYNFLVRKP